MNEKRRIEFLRAEIRRHNDLYYMQDAPEITDAEYDTLFRELAELEAANRVLFDPESPTQRVGGAPSSAFTQVRRDIPMLSLDNTYDETELREFDKRVKKFLADKGVDAESVEYGVELKFDGLSVELYY